MPSANEGVPFAFSFARFAFFARNAFPRKFVCLGLQEFRAKNAKRAKENTKKVPPRLRLVTSWLPPNQRVSEQQATPDDGPGHYRVADPSNLRQRLFRILYRRTHRHVLAHDPQRPTRRECHRRAQVVDWL